jgi:crotonobetainyl-CoA:carnitine CoA-transferase CaiB-like acyl-CoA transferase
MPTPRFSPLADIRVLDVTSSIAGPYCAMMLGALGADVIKVERPEGDDTRTWAPPWWQGESASFLAMNANKRSIVIDLKTRRGLGALLRAAATADVFIENLRPGSADALGIGFDAIAQRNGRVVYCSVGAFGRRGPLRSQPGYDPLMQASAGIMSITGEPGRSPVRVGPSLVDQGTGMWCLSAILAALRHRDADADAGPQRVEVALYETAVNYLPYGIAGYLGAGHVPGPMGTSIGPTAPSEAFETVDRRLVMIVTLNNALFERLCDVLGLPELAHDERFATNAQRVAHRDDLRTAIAQRMRRETAASWLAKLDAARVPAAMVQDIAEVVAHPQTQALGLLQPLPHRSIDDLRLVAPPIVVDDSRVEHRRGPPELGEHTVEVLREIGYCDEEIDELLAIGAVGDGSGRRGGRTPGP